MLLVFISPESSVTMKQHSISMCLPRQAKMCGTPQHISYVLDITNGT